MGAEKYKRFRAEVRKDFLMLLNSFNPGDDAAFCEIVHTAIKVCGIPAKDIGDTLGYDSSSVHRWAKGTWGAPSASKQAILVAGIIHLVRDIRN